MAGTPRGTWGGDAVNSYLRPFVVFLALTGFPAVARFLADEAAFLAAFFTERPALFTDRLADFISFFAASRDCGGEVFARLTDRLAGFRAGFLPIPVTSLTVSAAAPATFWAVEEAARAVSATVETREESRLEDFFLAMVCWGYVCPPAPGCLPLGVFSCLPSLKGTLPKH